MVAENSSSISEDQLFLELQNFVRGSGEYEKGMRVKLLENLQDKITSDSIQDKEKAVGLLLDIARIQGSNSPEIELISDSLSLLLRKNEEFFSKVFFALSGKEPNIYICFAKVILKLDYNRQKKLITPLIDFLMSLDSMNSNGAKEIYESLISVGSQKLGKEIARNAAKYLDSGLKIVAIIFSVRLCARFAKGDLLPRMLRVFEKSLMGYFDGHANEIQQEICQYMSRVRDQSSIDLLLRLLKSHSDSGHYAIKPLASVLDANPSRIADVLDVLYDERNENAIDRILQVIDEISTKVDVARLLQVTRTNWWWRHPANIYMRRILVKNGDRSKPLLLEALQDKEKYEFALECLKEIGISREELSGIFSKTLILQIYDFFYGKREKNPKKLDRMLEEKETLSHMIPGKPTMIEHLIFHIFAALNFTVLNVDSAGEKGVDLICFYPETLHLLIIGCTTGTLKDDIAKMDALLAKMESELPEIFKKCTVKPILVSLETSILPSHLQDAYQSEILVMNSEDIEKLIEMLYTERTSRDVIAYIKSRFYEQDGYISS